MAKVDEKTLMELKLKLENNIKLSREEKKILKENDKEAQEKKKNMSFGKPVRSEGRIGNSGHSGYRNCLRFAVCFPPQHCALHGAWHGGHV